VLILILSRRTIMKSTNYSVFDIIGPKMIGPSSSHTAGAAKIGNMAGRISQDDIKKMSFYLHGSFAKTYKGHGTDRALVAGVLGLKPNDKKLRDSFRIAKEEGLEYEFIETDLGDVHPNTVKVVLEYVNGKQSEIIGSSIGGGNIKIIQINGLEVEFTGEYPTLIVRHIDKPGIISEVTRVLGDNKINIATMNVFRQQKGENAFMIIELDSIVSEQILKEIELLSDDIVKTYMIDAF
jgi:L-serine dehydratase